MQKTILCFGDSNTWGWDPKSEKRLELDKRWPGVVRKVVGNWYWVIEGGFPDGQR